MGRAGGAMSDIRYAIRALVSSPGFAALAILTLALGIGANAAIFSVVNAVLIRALPYNDAERVVQIWTSTAEETRSNHSAGDFLDIARENQSLAALAGYRGASFSTAAAQGEASSLDGAFVTTDFFDALGVSALVGRTFSRDDGRTLERLVVLSLAAARDLYGSGERAVGKSIRVDGQLRTVSGVIPAAAAWPLSTRIWVLADQPVPPSPLDRREAVDPLTDREVRYFDAVARLRPGITLSQAQEDLDRVAKLIAERHGSGTAPGAIHAGLIREQIVGSVRLPLVIFQSAVALVLVIACANVSSLLLARAPRRRRELAVRAAIGATRSRLMRQLVTESVLLGAIAGGAGALLGVWLTALLKSMLPDSVPRADQIAFDPLVAGVMVAVGLMSTLLFGVVPALQVSRVDAASALRDAAGRGSSARTRARAALVVTEVALTLVLLAGAALLVNSLVRLQQVDTGLRPGNVTVAALALPSARYPTGPSQAALYRRLLENLAAKGEVQVAAVGFPSPLGGNRASGSMFIEGRDPSDRAFAHLGSVSGGYFAALGIPLLEGRTFTDSDTTQSTDVAVATRAFATRFWPGTSAIGKRVRFENRDDAPWRTVVGVVGDVRQLGLAIEPPPMLYIPYEQFPVPFTSVAIRSGVATVTIARLVRTEIAALDRDLSAGDIGTLQGTIDRSIADPRFRTFLLSSFALVALVLAAVGVYGLVSCSVSERTREIGIRVALGARPGQVLRAMMRDGVLLGATGILSGLIGALLSARLLSAFLFGVPATDPLTFIASAVILLAVSVLATYLPSRRALGVQPIAALRVE
jgi:putative ABC transport system permease protein